MNSKVVKNYLYDILYKVLLLITPLITTPYISRVLGVTNIGIYGYVTSIASYFVLFGTFGTALYGRREIAYYQDDELKRTKVFKEIITIRIFMCLIASILYLIMFCLDGEYVVIYRIYIVYVISNAVDISWFFQGLQDFKVTVLRNVIVKVIGLVSIFVFVKNDSQLDLYTLCTTIPTLLGHISLWPYLKKYVVVKKQKISLIKHIVPIISLFIPQIAIEIYTVLDKTMIGVLAENISEVGFYTQAQNIIKIVLQFVASIGTVMLPAMALDFKKGNKDSLIYSVKSSFRVISFVGIPTVAGIIAISDKFVPWFFGSDFLPVSQLMKITSFLIIIVGYSTVVGSQYLLATKQQKWYTISVIAGSLINFSLNMALIPLLGALGASIASVIAELSVSIIQIVYVKNKINLFVCTLQNWKYYLASIIIAFIIKVFTRHMQANIITTFFQIIIGIIIYIVVLLILKEDIMYSIMKNVKKFMQKFEDKVK